LVQLSTTPWRRRREWRYSPTILDFDTGWRCVVSFKAPVAFTTEERVRCTDCVESWVSLRWVNAAQADCAENCTSAEKWNVWNASRTASPARPLFMFLVKLRNCVQWWSSKPWNSVVVPPPAKTIHKFHPSLSVVFCGCETWSLKLREERRLMGSRGSSVGITGVRFPARERDFTLLHSFQTGSRVYVASTPVGTRDCFPRSKAARAWNWRLTSV
jgi:hypothetical protein